MDIRGARGGTFGALALLVCAAAQGSGSILWSPDHKLYAVSLPGKRIEKGEERERFVIYTERGEEIAVAHIWEIEPDGTMRVGIRGCERWGWIESTRLFCEGSINPSTGVYLVFDAKSGRELRELFGNNFVWSPDHSLIANFGNVPHFSSVEQKSDSVEIQGKRLYPDEKDTEQHWFRSELVWSPDNRSVAVVDHRRKQGALYLVIVGVNGRNSEYKLRWQIPLEEWFPNLDFSVRWGGHHATVQYSGAEQTFSINH